MSDSPTLGLSNYPVPLCFSCFLVALVQLVAAVIWTLQIYSMRLDISKVDWHLVSMVHWTCRLDGALDVSSRWCIGRLDSALDVSDIAWTLFKEPKEFCKYDLAKLVSPIDCVVTRSPKSLEMA